MTSKRKICSCYVGSRLVSCLCSSFFRLSPCERHLVYIRKKNPYDSIKCVSCRMILDFVKPDPPIIIPDPTPEDPEDPKVPPDDQGDDDQEIAPVDQEVPSDDHEIAPVEVSPDDQEVPQDNHEISQDRHKFFPSDDEEAAPWEYPQTEFDSYFDELTERIKEFRFLQAKHFMNLRLDINFRRAHLVRGHFVNCENCNPGKVIIGLLQKLNQESDELIKQVETHEKAFRKNFDQITQKLTKAYMENDLKTNFKFFNEQIEFVKELNKSFKLFEYDLNRNKLIPFVDNSEFGKLELPDDFIKSLDQQIVNLITCHFKPTDDVCEIDDSLNSINPSEVYTQSEIVFWNLNTNSVIQRLQGKFSCFTLYGSDKFITGSYDIDSVKVWNLHTLKCKQIFEGGFFFKRSISTDKSINSSQSIDSFNISFESETYFKKFVGIRLLKLLSNGEHLACVKGTNTILIFDLINNTCLFRMHNEGWISCLDQLPSGHLITAGEEIRIWDLVTNDVKIERDSEITGLQVECLKVLNIDNHFVTSLNNTIKFWDFRAWDIDLLRKAFIGRVHRTEMSSNEVIKHLEVTPDSDTIVCCSESKKDENDKKWNVGSDFSMLYAGDMNPVDLTRTELTFSFLAHDKRIKCIKFIPSLGNILISGTEDGLLQFHNVLNGELTRSINSGRPIDYMEIYH